MSIFNMFLTGPIPSNTISGHYDYGLVTLSYAVAVLTSYVALDLAGRIIFETNKRIKIFWLIGGAISMGGGIWSMHFIGMLAYIMPMEMSYNPFWTALSLLIAILGCLIAFSFLQYKTISK